MVGFLYDCARLHLACGLLLGKLAGFRLDWMGFIFGGRRTVQAYGGDGSGVRRRSTMILRRCGDVEEETEGAAHPF